MNDSAEHVLAVQNAQKSYGSNQALRGVDLQLVKGEQLALLGPNGAGKTTLVRALAGRVKLDGGTIHLFGDVLAHGGGKARRRMGVVPQEYSLYDTLTARENLEIFGKLHGVTGDRLKQRVEEVLDWINLADRAKDLVKGFSGGMKRRLNIAASILHEPEVVLLDEPTVGVDPQSRQRIWEMLGELKSRGASLMLTTHQLDEAESVCDRIVIIDHGKVISCGTLDELINRTVGGNRKVTLTVKGQVTTSQLQRAVTQNGSSLQFAVEDVAGELPALLQNLHDQDCRVTDVSIEAPSLHAVFIHLTGRELRE